MITNLKKIAILTTVMALPCAALAAPQIQFQGEVTDQTCKVDLKGNTGSIVLLPTVSISELGASGKKAGITPFTITVSDCATSETSSQTIVTEFLGENVLPEGILGNSTSEDGTYADNVGIQLLENPDEQVAINLNGVTRSKSVIDLAGQSSGEHTFGAQYYATGTATAGKVSAIVNYTISYQ
ncbi:TPA: fimbrial protein [Morganella morganii]